MSATWSVNRLAARAVALYGPGTPAQRRELLDMLGLVARDGTIAPDDTRIYDVIPLGDSPSYEPGLPVTTRAPEADRVNVPAGLAVLDPSASPEPVPGSGKACGTLSGRFHHKRRGEPLCRACKDAQNDYQRELRRRKRELAPPKPPRLPRPKVAKKRTTRVNPDLPPRPETCGSMAGRSNHLRRGEKPCRACADVYNATQRARRQRRRQERERGIHLVDTPPAVHVPGQMDLYTGQERSA